MRAPPPNIIPQRERLSDAELEDVMQDLLSLEQAEKDKTRHAKKKSLMSKEERNIAAAKELDMARQAIDIEPDGHRQVGHEGRRTSEACLCCSIRRGGRARSMP